MNEGILFGIGFIVFILVTTSVLMFGYARFNELYGKDRESGAKNVRTEGNVEFYAPPT